MVFSRRFYQSPAEVIDDRGFRAEVAAVDDDDALLKGFLSVVVFHIAGQIEVSPGLFRQINETGPPPPRRATRRTVTSVSPA